MIKQLLYFLTTQQLGGVRQDQVIQMRRDDIVGAFGECQGITDAEEKTYLWSLLSSQIRSAIKKHSDTIKEAE